MSLRLHNTLSGAVEELVPERPPELRMYVCGLTVYGRGHIGNYRSMLVTDLLRRTLRYKGYRVKEVMNITDVDDRIIQLASQAGSDLRSFTAEHVRSFEEDMATLRMERPEVIPRANPSSQPEGRSSSVQSQGSDTACASASSSSPSTSATWKSAKSV